MEIKKQIIDEKYVTKLIMEDDGREVGRAFLYFIYNDLHEEPYGLLEDVFVDEDYRNKGVGRTLVEAMISEAREQGCYKLIGTSRTERTGVHAFYEKLGLKKYGFEFRINF